MAIPKETKDLAPSARLLKGQDKRFNAGSPWIYSNEIAMRPELKALPPGSLIDIENARGEFAGQGIFNSKSLIAVRRLTAERVAVDKDFFKERIGAALRLRQKFLGADYYRLIHAEADFMPGLIVDRFGDVLVCEVNSAGMQNLLPLWMDALTELTGPRAVYLKNDSPARTLEGLAAETLFHTGQIDGPVTVLENGVEFLADIVGGQKTGWFYDQRANRAMVAGISRGKTVLDLYSYLGGFALAAAKAGARQVTAIDRSEASMNLARQAASQNKLSNAEFLTEQVFPFLENTSRRFDVVVADPPAFAKSAKDVGAAKMGYRKLAQLSANAVEPGGFLFIASCSYHMNREDFAAQVAAGVERAGRKARILRTTGADMDHPVHPMLPQTDYLKGLLLALD